MKTIKLGLEWFLNPDHLPFMVGLEHGWYKAAGIDLQLVEPEAHLDAVEAIADGTLDLAITEPIHLLQDRAAGHDVQGFARFLHTNGGIMYLASSGIERPRDLNGKRLQYPGAPGPGGLAMARTMFEADGGQGTFSMTPVNKGFAHTDALIEGAADAAVLAFYNFEIVEAGHRGHPARFFALKDWGVPDFCQLILIADAARIARDETTLRALLKVTSRALDFMHQQPDAAREIYLRRTETRADDPLMSDIFAKTVPCFTFDFSMSAAYYRDLGEWLVRTGLIEAAPTGGWTNRLVFG